MRNVVNDVSNSGYMRWLSLCEACPSGYILRDV